MLHHRVKSFLRSRLGQARLLDLACLPMELPGRLLAPLRRLPAPDRIAIVSMWDGNQAELASITAPNKAAYCKRWGYHWLPCTSGFVPERPVAWSKIPFIRDALENHDWVFWSDTDSLITNPGLPLSRLIRGPGDLLITRDRVGYNSGSFLLRRCPWTFAFLDEVWNLPDTAAYRADYDVATDRMWENRAIDMLLNHWRHRSHARVVPQRRLNSYLPEHTATDPSGAWRPGDFVLHLPGVANSIRVRELSSRMPPR